MVVIKVSGRSRTAAVAGAIAGIIREGSAAEVRAIGAPAVNQAVKAIAVAGQFLANEDVPIACIPTFIPLEIAGEQKTALRLTVVRSPQPLLFPEAEA